MEDVTYTTNKQTQETNIHALSGIRTRHLSCLLLHSYWRRYPVLSQFSCWRSPRNDTSSRLWRQIQENAALLQLSRSCRMAQSCGWLEFRMLWYCFLCLKTDYTDTFEKLTQTNHCLCHGFGITSICIWNTCD